MGRRATELMEALRQELRDQLHAGVDVTTYGTIVVSLDVDADAPTDHS